MSSFQNCLPSPSTPCHVPHWQPPDPCQDDALPSPPTLGKSSAEAAQPGRAQGGTERAAVVRGRLQAGQRDMLHVWLGSGAQGEGQCEEKAKPVGSQSPLQGLREKGQTETNQLEMERPTHCRSHGGRLKPQRKLPSDGQVHTARGAGAPDRKTRGRGACIQHTLHPPDTSPTDGPQTPCQVGVKDPDPLTAPLATQN